MTLAGLLAGVTGVAVVGGLLLAGGVVLARRARGLGWAAGAAAALGCAAAAAVVVGTNVAIVAGHPLAEAASTGASATVRVTLTDDPRPVRPATGLPIAAGGQLTIAADLIEAAAGAGRWTTGGRVLLIAPADGWSGLLPGQSVRAEGLLAPPSRSDLTVAVLRVRGAPVEITAPPWWQRAAGTLRDGLRTASGVLPERSAGLLPGLTVGDTRDQTPEVADDFRAAGLTHLTAVSGANLAVVAGAVLFLLRLLRAGPRVCAAGAGLALVGFVVLARPSPSVLRAAVMGGVVLLALAMGRKRSAVPALAVTVVGLLLWVPRLAVDPGFALSAAATAALVLIAPGWARRLRERGVPPGVAEALVIPAAAGIATAPLIAGLSGTVSLVSLLANLLAAPVVPPATVLGVLAAVLSVVSPAAAEVCAWLAGPEVGWLVLVADRAAAVQGGVVPWPSGWAGALLLVAVTVVLAVLVRSRRLRALLVAVLVGLLLVLVPTRVVTPGWPPAGWSVVACDVGQGDALVLATGSPGHAVLVDAGPDDGPVDACLARLGVHTLDLVVVSHLHADHVGGMSGALRDRAVGGIAVGPSRQPGTALRRLGVQAREAGTRVVALGPGQRLTWPGLVLDVLGPVHPATDVDPGDGTAVNDGSLVVRAQTRAGSALLTGDVEIAAQADLLAAGVPLRADVLKMPHHGSRYSLREFLAAVAPRVVLVSVGAGNSYRHPDPQLLAVLGSAGVAVRRTDHDGDTAVVAGASTGQGGPSVVSRGDPLPGRRRRARPGRARSVAGGQGLAHGLARGRDGRARGDAVGDGVERLQAVTGDEQDGLGVGVDLAGLDQLLRGRDGDATGGLGEDTLGAGQQLDGVAHLVVGDVADRAPGAAHRVQHVRAVGRVADRQRAGDRVRLDGADDVVALGERRRDRRAAGGLRAEHLVRGRLDEPELAELLETLVDLGQLRAGRDRDDDLLGQAPAELLGDLVAQRLRTLGVVRADVDVDERPLLVLRRELGGEPVDVVVVAVDGQQRAAVDGGGEDLGLLQRRRDQHDRVPPGARRRGGDGVGEVARRGAAQHGEAQLAGGGEGDGDDAVLEGVRRVARVVLDPQGAQAQGGGEAVGLDQPRHARLGVGVRLHVRRHGQQVAVAPDRLRAGLDRLTRDGGEVVGHLERAETLRTRELRRQGCLVAALAAGEGTGRTEVEAGGARRRNRSHRRISSSSPHEAGRNWHRDRHTRWSCDAGCRGVNGPFPLPLWMSHIRLCEPWTSQSTPVLVTTVRHLSPGREAAVRHLGGGSRPRRVLGHDEGVTPPAADATPPHPVHLVVGEEELLAERAVQDIVTRARAADPETDVRRMRIGEIAPEDLAEHLSPSLFAEGRVVVLTSAQEAAKGMATAVLRYAAEPADGIVVVLVHQGGARGKSFADDLRKAGAEVVRCDRLTRPAERADFVRAEVRRLGGKITGDALEVLMEAVGSDLRELASAAGQLVADTGGAVDEKSVRRYHRGKAESSGFTVADKVVAGDRAGALEALRWALVLGVAPVLVADALADAVRTLAKVGAAGRGDPNRLASSLGMPPWKIRKAQGQVRSWRPEGLAVAFAAAAEANADVKGAAADPEFALERAVRRIIDAREMR